MRIYLDVCCLNRPFNDLTQKRIRMEAEAIRAILEHVDAGEHIWISSAAVVHEIGRDPDPARRDKVARLLRYSREDLPAQPAVTARAKVLEKAGLGALDALHLAFAEAARCDILFTTDDRFLRRVKRGSLSATVRVENPARWLLETQDGNETA